MTDQSPARRGLAAALLVASVGISGAAAWLLQRIGERSMRRPDDAGWCFLPLAASVTIAFAAGRLVSPRPAESASPARPAGRRFGWGRVSAAVACGLLLAGALLLPGKAHPLLLIAAWIASMAAGGLAVPGPGGGSGESRKGRLAPFGAALVVLLAAAAWARLPALDRSPAAFGGDEGNQISDGVDLLRMRPPQDPFGVGWGDTGRLGMLLSVAGRATRSNEIAGARLPYAIAGTASVGAAAGAAWIAAGSWGGLAAAALLAFTPHHVHFSRLANVMILDALFASLTVLFLFRAARGSAVAGYFAGIAAGLALYGYAGGRVVAVTFLLSAPLLFLFERRRIARPGLLAAALAAGFLLSAGPALRYAATHLRAWNLRFEHVVILSPEQWGPRAKAPGGARAVLTEQFLSGTIGLLSQHTSWNWFTGYPIVSPFWLPALSLSGIGWLLGRRRPFEVAAPVLIAAGNVAGVVLTESVPAPQRLSSLFPMLGVLAGAAVGGLLSLLPEKELRSRVHWRPMAGVFLVGLFLAASYRGAPDTWDPSPGYSGDGGRFVSSIHRALAHPRFDGETVYLHTRPYLESSHPSFRMLLPRVRWVDGEEPNTLKRPDPGIHVYFREWIPQGRAIARSLGVRHVASLADAEDPLRELGILLRVPAPP